MPKRPVVVLDLDNTILCSVPLTELSKPAVTARLKAYAHEAGSQLRKTTMPGQYVVYARPGLEQFLDNIMSHCDVVIFTMASLSYAWWVIRTYILANKAAERRKRIRAVLTEPQCSKSRDHAKARGLLDAKDRLASSSPKWLSYLFDNHPELGLEPNKTVFLDDLPSVQKANSMQIIHTPAFDVLKPGAGDDRFLWDVQVEVVRRLRA